MPVIAFVCDLRSGAGGFFPGPALCRNIEPISLIRLFLLPEYQLPALIGFLIINSSHSDLIFHGVNFFAIYLVNTNECKEIFQPR